MKSFVIIFALASSIFSTTSHITAGFDYVGSTSVTTSAITAGFSRDGGAGCTDSINYLGVSDSSDTTIVHSGVALCSGTLHSIWELVDGSDRDSTAFVVDSGDTVIDTVEGLTASTEYRLQMRLGAFLSYYDSVATEAGVDTDTVDICVGTEIDSVVNLDGRHDTGLVGDTVRLFVNEIKTTDSVFLNATAQNIVARGLDTLRFVVSGTSGQLRVKDSCGTWDSLAFYVDAVTQFDLTTSVTGSGSVTPGDTTVDSASGFAITATPGVGYDFSGWTVVSGTILFNADSSRCSLSTAATL
jgi:hypothetical protein